MDFTCKGCSLSFKDKFAFFMHFFSNLCVAKQTAETESTEKENRTVIDLKHLRSNDSNVCEVCGKMCWPFEGLAKHILTHVGAMPYFCPFCHFSSLSKLHLQTHISFHSARAKNGIQKFPSKLKKIHVCDSCNCAFTDWKDLAIHYVKHLKETPFKCNICCMMFLEKDDFNIHRHLHKTSLFCEFCEVSFNNRLDCLEHVLTHNKSKMFRKFSLVIPYERLMKLKTSWYHDFFSDSNISEQHLFGNPNQSYDFLTEENDSSNFESRKQSQLLYLNHFSTQTEAYQPSALIDFNSANNINNSESAECSIRENVVQLCKTALDDKKEDQLICSLVEKSIDSDILNYEGMQEKTINALKYSNDLKTFSENKLSKDITVISDVCAIQTESIKSSVHPIKCSNAELKLIKTSDNLAKQPKNVQNIKSCKNFHDLQSEELKVNFNKLCKQTNFKSAVLNENSEISDDKLNGNILQLSPVADYDFYSMQFRSNHSKSMFDYSVHNNHKITEVEIRENVSHLCEVIFEEGKEDIFHNCSLSKTFTKEDLTLKKSPEASLNLLKFSNLNGTSERELNETVTFALSDGQYNLTEVLNNNHSVQQLNYYNDANAFNEGESEHGLKILSSIGKKNLDLDCSGNSKETILNDEMHDKDLAHNKESIHFSNTFCKNNYFDYHMLNTHPLPESISFQSTQQNQKLDGSEIRNEAEHDNLYSSFFCRKPSSPKVNKMNCLIDLVKNLKDVNVVLEKLPKYVCDMPSFRKYKKTKNSPNKYLSSAHKKNLKLSSLRAKNSMLHRVKTKGVKNTACITEPENSSSNTSIFSKSSLSTDETLHCLHKRSQRWKICGTRKKKTNSKKKSVSHSFIKSIPQKSNDDSSATDTATETCSDSDSSSGISDFMQRWLLNSPQNSDNSSLQNKTFSFVKTKKPILKLCQKRPRKHSRKTQFSFNSIQEKKPFVRLWKLPNYIYEKHKKCKPIMLSSLLPMIEETEHILEKQQDTSQVLHDHNYCFPSDQF